MIGWGTMWRLYTGSFVQSQAPLYRWLIIYIRDALFIRSLTRLFSVNPGVKSPRQRNGRGLGARSSKGGPVSDNGFLLYYGRLKGWVADLRTGGSWHRLENAWPLVSSTKSCRSRCWQKDHWKTLCLTEFNKYEPQIPFVAFSSSCLQKTSNDGWKSFNLTWTLMTD